MAFHAAMPANDYTIRARHGDNLALPIRLFDNRGRQRDLTNAVFRTIVRDGPTAQADAAPGNLNVVVTNAARGLAEIRLAATALPAGCYYYEVDLVAGATIEGLLYGQLIVTEGLI